LNRNAILAFIDLLTKSITRGYLVNNLLATFRRKIGDSEQRKQFPGLEL